MKRVLFLTHVFDLGKYFNASGIEWLHAKLSPSSLSK